MMTRQQFSLSVSLIILAVGGRGKPAAGEPITPAKVIRLFNGTDLKGFYSHQQETGRCDP